LTAKITKIQSLGSSGTSTNITEIIIAGAQTQQVQWITLMITLVYENIQAQVTKQTGTQATLQSQYQTQLIILVHLKIEIELQMLTLTQLQNQVS
jgi:hypothetical protein